MPSKSKQKGNRFEREVTNLAKEHSIYAILPYGDFLELIADDEEYRNSGQEKLDEELEIYAQRRDEIEREIKQL